jgi:hypothetical protein
MTRRTGNLPEDRNKFLIMSRLILIRTRNISKRRCTENQTTFFIEFFLPSKIIRIMRWCEKNSVQPGRPKKTTWRIRTARWKPKATNEH